MAFFKFIKKNLALIFAIVIFISIQSFFYNLPIDFRDEGFLNYLAQLINQGRIPYNDFFLTTTPGSFYIQALLLNLFGDYLIIGRILYTVICILILILANKVYALSLFEKTVFLATAAIVLSGSTFAFYNIEGLLLTLLSFYLLRLSNTKSLLLAGIVCGFLFLVKQSYGVAIIGTYTLLLLLQLKGQLKEMVLFLVGAVTPLLLYALYLLVNETLLQALYYVFLFAGQVKSHRTSFITTLLISIPLYIVFIKVIVRKTLGRILPLAVFFVSLITLLYIVLSPDRIWRITTIISDPLIYYYLALILLPLTIIALFLTKKSKIDKDLFQYACVSLALFIASSASGRDYVTVQMVTVLYIPIVIRIYRNIAFIPLDLRKSFLIVICFLYSLPFIISHVQKHIAHAHLVPSTKLEKLAFIRIEKATEEELAKVVSVISNNTTTEDTVLCFPYCPMINFLTERNSPSYHSFFYKETFLQSSQQDAINELKNKKPSLFVIQKSGLIEKEAQFEDERLSLLKMFMHKNSTPILETNNFIVSKTTY